MALWIYGLERIAVPIVLGARAAVGNTLCLVGGPDDVGVQTSITGSDKNGESHCEGRGSRPGERAGGRVWSGRLGQDSWGLDLQEDIWLWPRSHESFGRALREGPSMGPSDRWYLRGCLAAEQRRGEEPRRCWEVLVAIRTRGIGGSDTHGVWPGRVLKWIGDGGAEAQRGLVWGP